MIESMAEITSLVPIILPFIIGLLIGVIIKRGLKLIVPVVALILVVVLTGIVSFGFGDIYSQAAAALPQIIGGTGSLVNLLPYTSVSFIVGLLLGLFKG
jgi:uncharacterized membrane protein (Fun14 family)